MSVASPIPPPPRRALRVGGIGHIQLAGADDTALRDRIRGILGTVQAQVTRSAGAVGLDDASPPRLILVSALAAGADQLIAEIALELGYELHAATPFLAEEYEKDFEGDPVATESFRNLKSKATHLLELGQERSPAPGADRSRAYLTVGRLIVAESDLLLAVWDGKPPRGRGGTGEVVQDAYERQVPVVVLPMDRPADATLRLCDEPEESCISTLDALPAVVGRILDPFDATRKAPVDLAVERAEILAAQRKHYAEFLSERDPADLPAARRALRAPLVAAWKAFSNLVRGGGPVAHAATPPSGSPLLDAHAAWADRLAGHYSTLYRGAFLVNYGLSAVAVTMAVLGLLLGGRHGPVASAIAITEVVAISLILLIFWRGRAGRWHEKGVNYRVLAELFRQARETWRLGLAVPMTRPRAHLHGEADLTLAWTVGHFRAVVRDTGWPTVRLDRDALQTARTRALDGWIEAQLAYHTTVAERLGRGVERLEKTSFLLFLAAAAACVLHFFVGEGAHAWLGALAATLPAWAAAVHGTLGQTEWTRLAERSEGMRLLLAELASNLKSVPPEALSWRTLAETAEKASVAMVRELDDWQALSRAGDVPAA